tara:strand:+ start:74 stop:268 length:195 start_codon:yes stop_codon:yes gene_type:complete
MEKFKVTVTQRNIFYVDQDEFDQVNMEPSEANAKQIATEFRIWDENQSNNESYEFDIEAEKEVN